MRTLSLSAMTALVAVLEHKSFTKAAQHLGLSPARVSELVRNLEERVGVRLVERTTRSVAGTPAGERLLERIRPLLEEYQAALDSLNDYRSKPAGTLRLTVAPPAADFVLAPVIARFLAQYPQITLDVSVDRAFVDIVEGRFDAGVRPGKRIAGDMVAVRISDDMPFVVAASPAYLKRHGRPEGPDELMQHVCIQFRFPTGALVPWRFRKGRRTLQVEVAGQLIVNEPGIAITAAINGAGLIQVPLPYVSSDLAAGRLVSVLTDQEAPRIDNFYLYYSGRRQMRPPLKALVDFLRESYRRGAPKPKVRRV